MTQKLPHSETAVERLTNALGETATLYKVKSMFPVNASIFIVYHASDGGDIVVAAGKTQADAHVSFRKWSYKRWLDARNQITLRGATVHATA